MKFPLVRWTAPVLLALSAGCGDTIAPTFPSFASTPQFFSGSLAPAAASGVFTFSLKVDGGARVTLGSVTSLATGEPDATTLLLSLGTLSGGGCAPTTSKTVAAALTGQVTTALRTGDYCVTLADADSLLTQPVNFTIRVVTSVGISPDILGNKLDLLPSTLARGSFALKTFQVGGIGTLKLSLTGVGPTGAAIKISLGLWDGDACRLSTAIISAPSADPLITTTADAGSYCVVLTDIGNLTAQVGVSGTIQHP